MIWKRYLTREIIKIFSLVLFGFFFIYCTLDYSMHMQDFIKDKKIHLADFFLYYSHLFIKRADLLISLAMLIATIKVLCSFNAHRELLALQVGGLKFKKLLRPFFLIAGICCVFNYISAEFILPSSLSYLDNFHSDHFRHSKKNLRITAPEKLHVIPLNDRSKIVYQFYDASQENYFDVIWIRSAQDIWRMKYLNIEGEHPVGQFVDHLTRNAQGFFEKTESFLNFEFTALKWNKDTKASPFIPYENRKASQLWKIAHTNTTTSYEKAEILSHFFFKCAMPLLPLLTVIGAAPFCIRYSRIQRAFFTYAFGIFAFVTFYLIMNASVTLGENNVVRPFMAIFFPFALATGFFSWKFIKTN